MDTKDKHAGGRPTDYDQKYCEEIIKYFNIEPHFETPVEKQLKNGTVTTSVKFIASDLPTLAGFASKIGVCRDTLNEWETKYPEFSDAIKRCKSFQENILVTNALKGSYNPTFSIFFAKNNMNWKDKTETDITSEGKQIVGFNYISPNDKNNSNNSTTT